MFTNTLIYDIMVIIVLKGGNMYSPKKFAEMIGKSVKTLQRWDREGILVAKRSPTNRRYYTEEDYKNYIEGNFDALSSQDRNKTN